MEEKEEKVFNERSAGGRYFHKDGGGEQMEADGAMEIFFYGYNGLDETLMSPVGRLARATVTGSTTSEQAVRQSQNEFVL